MTYLGLFSSVNTVKTHTFQEITRYDGGNQKSKTFLRGPKLLDLLVFLGFFWFSNRNPKTHMVFFDFRWKTKKTQSFFGFLLENQKTLGKPKNPKVSGPSERFWIFGFVVPSAETKNSKKSKTFLRGPKLLDLLVVLGLFWFSNRNPKNHMFFLF